MPATIFFLAFYLALPIAVGFVPELMSRPIAGALTYAYAFAVAQFVMAWALLAVYMRRARKFDVMQEAFAQTFRSEIVQ